MPKKASYLIGGTFNAIVPTLQDGDLSPLQLNSDGTLRVAIVGGSASNPAAGATGAPVPADASYTGINIGGNLQGQTGFSLGSAVAASVAIVDGSGNQITSFGGGTQYADGTTQATPTGTVALGRNPSNVLHALPLDASNNLLVTFPSAQHVIVDSGTVGISGNVNVTQGTSPWVISFTAPQHVIIDSGSTGVTQGTSPWVTSDQADVAGGGTIAPTKVLMVGGKTNDVTPQYDILPLGASGRSVIIEGFAGGTAVPISGAINFTAPQHVIVDSGSVGITGTVDVSDRAARLVGVVYGSQAQQLKQTATNFNLQVELATGATLYDARQIRALTSADVVTVVFPASPIVWIKGNAGATLDSTIGAATAPTNALAVSGVYQSTIPVLTAGQAVALQVDTTGSLNINLEGRKTTYSAVANSTSTATFTAAAGDIAVMPGSASKTIRVTRVEVTLSTTGTAAIETVSLVKRSAADTGGTSSAMTIVPHDSNFGAASAAPLLYTVAPTPGAAVGIIRATQFNDQSASLPGSATWIWTFGDGRGGASGLVLRGTAQELCVNLAGVVATQTAAVSFEWTEE